MIVVVDPRISMISTRIPYLQSISGLKWFGSAATTNAAAFKEFTQAEELSGTIDSQAGS